MAIIYWAVAFYAALVLQFELHVPSALAVLLGIPTAFAALYAWPIVLYAVVRPVISRLAPAVDVRAPATEFRSAGGAEPWVVAPRLIYPVRALLRGQSGWVALQVRREADGRIAGYRILDQAPGRTFEAAVVRGLHTGRLKPPPQTPDGDVAKTLISFALDPHNPPAWLRKPEGPWSE